MPGTPFGSVVPFVPSAGSARDDLIADHSRHVSVLRTCKACNLSYQQHAGVAGDFQGVFWAYYSLHFC